MKHEIIIKMRYEHRHEWKKHRENITKLVNKGVRSYRSEHFEFRIQDLEPIVENKPDDITLQCIKAQTRVENMNGLKCKVIPSRMNFEQ